MINTADEVDQWLGICFNCSKAGHLCRDCTEPLRESLEQLNWETWQLNKNWGARAKGVRIPQSARNAKAPLPFGMRNHTSIG